MLQLKLAEGFVDVSLNMSRYYADMARLRRDLTAMSGVGLIPVRADLRQWRRAMVQVYTDLHAARVMANIPVTANAGAAHASLNLLLQHLRTVQSAARINVRMNGGGASGPASPRSSGINRGGSFLSGVAQGTGLGYTSNPYMLAGDLTAKTALSVAHAGIDLEARYERLRAIANLTTGDLQKLKRAFLDLSTSAGNAAPLRDIIEMTTTGARMGIADKEGVEGLQRFASSMAALRTVVDDMSQEKLSEETMRVLSAFGLGTEHVRGFASALTALDNSSNASAADILNISSRLAGYASAAKLSIQETMALAATMRSVGISNEVAGTSFSQILHKMGTDQERFAHVVGITTDQWAKAYREGPLVALKLLFEKMHETGDSVEMMEFLDEIHLRGARTAGTFLKLSNAIGDVTKLSKTAGKEFVTGDALKRRQEIESQTSESHLTRAASAFQGAAETFYNTALKQSVDATADTLTEAATALSHTLERWVGAMTGNPVPGGRVDVDQKMPPPPKPEAALPRTLRGADEALQKAADDMRDAWHAIRLGKARPADLQGEANQLFARAFNNPAMRDAGMKKMAEMEAAQRAIPLLQERAREKEEAFFAAKKNKEEVEARLEKEGKGQNQPRGVLDRFADVAKAVRGGLADIFAKQAGPVDRFRRAADALAKQEKPKPHYSVTTNSAFESGVRLQEAVLNRDAEKDKRTQQGIEQNTADMKTALRDVVVQITGMRTDIKNAAMGK